MTPDSPQEHRSVVRRSPLPPSASTPVATPLYPSVVYRAADADELDRLYDGEADGFSYAREGHPNQRVLEDKLDWLEGLGDDDPRGTVTGSGMAAISALFLGLVSAGDHIVAGNQLYGRSLRLLTDDLSRLGISSTLVDASDGSAVEAAITDKTRLLLVEVVSNPTLRVADMNAIARISAERGIVLAVDNTFTTARMYRPFDHGADVVINSVTKMLAGHADVTLGHIAARRAEHATAIEDAAVTWGLTPSPFDCWLAERGLHTFEIRYDRAESNAVALAEALGSLGGVESVIYPGRDDHPDRALAKELFGGRTGTMVSFRLRGGRKEVNAFLRGASHVPFAPTLGDVATTLSHPASSSHRRLSEEAQRALGITEGFIRVSAGIEDVDQVIGELTTAIESITSP